MKILLIHQNFPGQFKHLAPALTARGDQVVALSLQAKEESQWCGVRVVPYQVARGTTPQVHPWVADFETKTIRAEACFHAARALRDQGFEPDVIVAHPGWGESLFLKDVWPRARLGVYCEFYYRPEGADTGFDPEFGRPGEGDACRLRLKNLNNLLHFQVAEAGISPTYWQASTFPRPFKDRITVVHDGIDTEAIKPDPGVNLRLGRSDGQSLALTRQDEIITFVNRNLEPYRGYHVFMRSLPDLMSRHPEARVLIVGGDGVSYGAQPADGLKWKDIFGSEVRPKMPEGAWDRVHFLGHIPYHLFVPLLQLSRVHVYLTYPFVLSWSLLEAMSAGCAIVASDTQPLHEAIEDGRTGRLVNFFDPQALAERISELLQDAPQRKRLGQAARLHAQAHYDLQKVCLPRQLQWVDALAASEPLAEAAA
jgi:glycosyltransferase involved in cell wall biosynthesis